LYHSRGDILDIIDKLRSQSKCDKCIVVSIKCITVMEVRVTKSLIIDHFPIPIKIGFQVSGNGIFVGVYGAALSPLWAAEPKIEQLRLCRADARGSFGCVIICLRPHAAEAHRHDG
jgi:hypothetical protein